MLQPAQVISHYGLHGPVRLVADQGLINKTWTVGSPSVAVLQWVNPIFDPTIHLDIDAVTGYLSSIGLTLPCLRRTLQGQLWVDDDEGCWRVQDFIPGATVHRLSGQAMAHEVGRLVGRFHASLADWSYTFQAPRRQIHDTPARFAELTAALDQVTSHPLLGEVHALADDLLRDWQGWDGSLDLPERICHGDLKVSNVRFSSHRQDEVGPNPEALCLLDLDTLGPQRLVDEMGDAWRSWCNPHGEDDPEACRFDLELFAASARGWLDTFPNVTVEERQNLVPAIERICLELSSRFLADALRNSYFREDRERYPEAGRHNLQRARGQWRLAASVRQQRTACEAILGTG